MSEKIICLGIEFNSEEERREYFRNELRAKLLELKKIEGFPIGEDEDIINLSDPPYYTACPNPWLNDFIAEWEIAKETIPNRRHDFAIKEPYASDVSEGKSNPIYTVHSYHTKVPHPAIMRYLLYYTQPGDIVLDAFGGTGMTGVAAGACNSPNPKLKFQIESEFQMLFGQEPNWGKRNAIVSDLSPLASFLSSVYNSKIDILEFETEAKIILSKLKKEFSWMYKTIHSNGIEGQVNYVVWSHILLCSNCGSDIVFWDAAVNSKTKELQDSLLCVSCNKSHEKKDLEYKWNTVFDSLLKTTTKSIVIKPVLIKYTANGKS